MGAVATQSPTAWKRPTAWAQNRGCSPAASGSCVRTARHDEPAEHQHDTQGEKAKVPLDGTAEVVADVMDAEKLVVHETFDDIEDPPADEQHPEVRTPGRREASLLPGTKHQPRTDGDQHPLRYSVAASSSVR